MCESTQIYSATDNAAQAHILASYKRRAHACTHNNKNMRTLHTW